MAIAKAAPTCPRIQRFTLRRPAGADNILAAGDIDHSRMRRYISHAFSTKALEEQQYILKEDIDVLIQRLREQSGQEVDLVAWYNWTTFDNPVGRHIPPS
jgi:cytochrome P450